MAEEKKLNGPKSLNKRLLVFMLLCWVVPIAVFFAFTTFSYRRAIVEKTEGLMEDQLENIASFVSLRISDAISKSQQPSYEGTWDKAWNQFKRGEKGLNEYLSAINNDMRVKFYMDDRFDLCAFYRNGYERPECYSSRVGISRQDYLEEIHPYLWGAIQMDTSYAYIMVVKGRVFIVRNLYTTSYYHKYGTLVLELNQDKLFRDIKNDVRENMQVCIDSSSGIIDFTEAEENDERISLGNHLKSSYNLETGEQVIRVSGRKYNGYLYQDQHDNYHIGIMLYVKRSELFSSLYELYTIVGIMLLLFVPIIGFGIHFLRREIKIPIDRMMTASRKMEGGEIGITVGGGQMPNSEFQYLMESFDSMSSQVKYLFDYVYDEKLARKDAQIQALQAQINPHFLNNTLEMMNWQARMSGDAVVSRMIESLSTVLNYRMNRANVKEIRLAEELQCTDAYFYIMSMRFGQRLSIEKEIDDALLYIMVPPLILQPIVENAIVHGVEAVKNGAIHLKVYHDELHVYLEVSNTGKEMTEEEKQRIREILDGDETNIPQAPGKHTSIGIRNVNRRIKLVYGEQYGLSIKQDEHLVTVSMITIPFREYPAPDSLKERIKVESELKNMARLNK